MLNIHITFFFYFFERICIVTTNVVNILGISPDNSSYGDQNGVKQKLVLAYKSNLDEKLKAEVVEFNDDENDVLDNKKHEQWSTTWLQQVMVLLKRGVKERKHEFFSTLKIGQVIAVSFLCGLLWWQSDKAHLQDQV